MVREKPRSCACLGVSPHLCRVAASNRLMRQQSRPVPPAGQSSYQVVATREMGRDLADTGRWLGIACANLINLLNLEMIIIGGGVMASGELLLGHAVDIARRCAFGPSFADCRIVQSKLWPNAGMIGAALLARDR